MSVKKLQSNSKDSFKYIIIGNTEVGKSSLLLQFTERQFKKSHDMTIGVEMGTRLVEIGEKTIKLDIWDTAGQESYLSITRSYYRSADGCLLVYDISCKESFDSLPMWLSEARQHSNNPNLVILMIGNKADLSNQRTVTTEQAQTFAQSNGLIFMELSATNYKVLLFIIIKHNMKEVEDAFLRTAEEVLNRIQEYGRAKKNGIQLGDNTSSSSKKKKKNDKSNGQGGGQDCCK